jgi:hypothetical protein
MQAGEGMASLSGAKVPQACMYSLHCLMLHCSTDMTVQQAVQAGEGLAGSLIFVAMI